MSKKTIEKDSVTVGELILREGLEKFKGFQDRLKARSISIKELEELRMLILREIEFIQGLLNNLEYGHPYLADCTIIFKVRSLINLKMNLSRWWRGKRIRFNLRSIPESVLDFLVPEDALDCLTVM